MLATWKQSRIIATCYKAALALQFRRKRNNWHDFSWNYPFPLHLIPIIRRTWLKRVSIVSLTSSLLTVLIIQPDAPKSSCHQVYVILHALVSSVKCHTCWSRAMTSSLTLCRAHYLISKLATTTTTATTDKLTCQWFLASVCTSLLEVSRISLKCQTLTLLPDYLFSSRRVVAHPAPAPTSNQSIGFTRIL